MTFFKKAIVSVLLGSTIGATTICMDTDDSIAARYLKIKLKDKPTKVEELEAVMNLRIVIDRVGGKVIYFNKCDRSTHALLPTMQDSDNKYLVNTLEKKYYELKFKEGIPKWQQPRHHLNLKPNKQGMDHTTLEMAIKFAGGKIFTSTNSEISADLPDQSILACLGGDHFIPRIAKLLGYTVRSCDEIRDEFFYVDSGSDSYLVQFLSFIFNSATDEPSEEFLSRHGYSSAQEYYQERKDERAEAYHDSMSDRW